jgi:hypothetical protein
VKRFADHFAVAKKERDKGSSPSNKSERGKGSEQGGGGGYEQGWICCQDRGASPNETCRSYNPEGTGATDMTQCRRCNHRPLGCSSCSRVIRLHHGTDLRNFLSNNNSNGRTKAVTSPQGFCSVSSVCINNGCMRIYQHCQCDHAERNWDIVLLSNLD